VVEVYFGPHLLGQLHASDQAGIRAVRFRSWPNRPPRRGG
jgi:hypothetical protein